MQRTLKMCWMVGIVLLATAAPAFAQADAAQAEPVAVVAQEVAVAQPLINLSPAFGAGLIILGAGFGIAKIGAAAVESMARQPEAASNIQGGMLLAAALIEGATFFALIVCIIAIFG